MSDIASAARLAPSSSQLPISWYFDEKLYDLEKKLLFDAGPGYIGHELMVPNRGDYHSIEWQDHAKVLVNNDAGIELLSNVCRHRQAVMMKGRGRDAQNIVCPLHRWTYDLEGTLLGAPHFPANPCLHLGKSPLARWNGMLFNGKRDVVKDLGDMNVASDLDFSGYMLDRVVTHECNYSWRTFIEVYLEDYHVVPFHPGLGNFVVCDNLKWQFGDWYSVQTVGVTDLQKSGSPVYDRWQKAVTGYQAGKPLKHGAIWLVYYPNIMVEWYPNVLVVSHVVPRGIDKCTNVVEFYYPEDICLFEREYVEAQQAAYMETAIEDDDIAERMDQGRRALWRQGINEVGPYQSPTEDGMQHFHEFLRRELGPAYKEMGGQV